MNTKPSITDYQPGDEDIQGSPWYDDEPTDDDIDEGEEILTRMLCGIDLHDAIESGALDGPPADDWIEDASLLDEEGASALTGAALWRLIWAGDAASAIQARDELVERLRERWASAILMELGARAKRRAEP